MTGTRGEARASLNQQRGMAGEDEAACTQFGVKDVKVAGEEEVGSAAGEFCHGVGCSTNAVFLAKSGRQIEWVVSYDDFDQAGREFAKPLPHALDLAGGDVPSVDGEGACGVDADNGEFVVLIKRFEVVADVAAVSCEWQKKTREHVVEGHVVIAGDNDARTWKALKEFAGLTELRGAGALCEITGDDGEVGADGVDDSEAWLDESGIDAPEVKVRQVDYGAHALTPPAVPVAEPAPARHLGGLEKREARSCARFRRRRRHARSGGER